MAIVTGDTAHRSRFELAAPWIATAARLVLGVVWIVAGSLKLTDLPASVRAVRAYELLPETAAQLIGAGLPLVEVVLGALLLVGLGTRVCAAISMLLMGAFVVGIASAWARGLQIDCGCFGSGGQLGPGQRPTYGLELLRDIGLLVLAGFLAWRPYSRWAVDRWLVGPGPTDPEPTDPVPSDTAHEGSFDE
jgi:uncharacterized membrane protein YphA (DoxX/SURF4 family)